MTTETQTAVTPAEAIRKRVEETLAAEQVDLTRESGRERTLSIIEQEIADHHAHALSNGGSVELSEQERTTLARSLRDDLIGLGAIAEQMLSDETAQEWMVNSPKRVFRDNGQRIERVPDVASKMTGRSVAFLERLLEEVEGKRLDRITPPSRHAYQTAPGSRQRSRPSAATVHVSAPFAASGSASGALHELVALGFLSTSGRRLPRRVRERR